MGSLNVVQLFLPIAAQLSLVAHMHPKLRNQKVISQKKKRGEKEKIRLPYQIICIQSEKKKSALNGSGPKIKTNKKTRFFIL